MNEVLITFSICFAFCFFFEGVDIAINSDADRIYKAVHIVYPLFIIATLVYLLMTGVAK